MRAHWNEYPVSKRGEMVFAVRGMLGGLGFGLAACFALVLGLMLPAELGLTQSSLVAMGADERLVAEFLASIEPIVRVFVVVTLILGAVAMVGGGVTSALADSAVSNALTKAARDGASRSAVPTPQQVRRIDRTKWPALDVMVGILIVLAGLAGIVLIGTGLLDDFDEAVVAGAIALLVTVTLCGLLRILRRTRRRLVEQRLQIAEHWTTEDEQAAWDAAHELADADRTGALPSGKRVGRHRWVRSGFVVGRLAFAGIVVLPLAMLLIVAQFFPGARRYGKGVWEVGERIPDGAANATAWGSAALLVLALFGFALLPLIGVGLEWAGVRAERRELIRALPDGAAERPSARILQAHSERALPESALLCAHIAGIMIGPALGVLFIAVAEPGGHYEGVEVSVRDLVGPAVAAIAASAALLVTAALLTARADRDGRAMRNGLMARWPVIPRPETRSKGEETVPIRATVGPALTPPVDDQDGAGVESDVSR